MYVYNRFFFNLWVGTVLQKKNNNFIQAHELSRFHIVEVVYKVVNILISNQYNIVIKQLLIYC